MQEFATCRLQPITAYRPIDGISLLVTVCTPDWHAWDLAPPISLQHVSFIAVVIGLLQVACCMVSCSLHVVSCNFYRIVVIWV